MINFQFPFNFLVTKFSNSACEKFVEFLMLNQSTEIEKLSSEIIMRIHFYESS
jgi:hypothetical protein